MTRVEYEIKAVKTAAKQLHYDFVMPGVCARIESAYAEDPTGGRASAIMATCRKRMDRLYDLGLYTLAPVKNAKVAKIQKMTSVPVGYQDTVSCVSQCYAEGMR